MHERSRRVFLHRLGARGSVWAGCGGEESTCHAMVMLKGVKPADATLDQKLEAIEEVGRVAASMAYSGDVVQLKSDNPDLEFVYPDEGVLAPEVAAYVNYFSPVQGVREILEKTDAELAANPLIFPPDDVKARLYTKPAVSAADQRAAQKAMAAITGS